TLAERGAAEVGVKVNPVVRVAGTPAYMAPEQWRGDPIDASTDLWAIGVILYRLLAEVAPFIGTSRSTFSMRVQSGRPPTPIGEICQGIPEALADLVERLLRSEPAERPSDISEVIQTLEGLSSTAFNNITPLPTSFASRAFPQSSISWSNTSIPGWLIHETTFWNASRYW